MVWTIKVVGKSRSIRNPGTEPQQLFLFFKLTNLAFDIAKLRIKILITLNLKFTLYLPIIYKGGYDESIDCDIGQINEETHL